MCGSSVLCRLGGFSSVVHAPISMILMICRTTRSLRAQNWLQQHISFKTVKGFAFETEGVTRPRCKIEIKGCKNLQFVEIENFVNVHPTKG